MLLATALICLLSSPVIADTYIGTYEVSYIYNSMSNGVMPTGSMEYNGIWTEPIKVLLNPGSYYTAFVPGRITGNDFYDYGYTGYLQAYYNWVPVLNPSSVYPATGFNGGNTDPLHNDPANGWWWMVAGWVGTSETQGTVFWGGQFNISPGQSLWLYWTDPWIYDNLGGVTLQIWQTPAAVPLPAALLLFAPGLVGLAAIRRRFKK
jgi:hypothetical protein